MRDFPTGGLDLRLSGAVGRDFDNQGSRQMPCRSGLLRISQGALSVLAPGKEVPLRLGRPPLQSGQYRQCTALPLEASGRAACGCPSISGIMRW